MTARSRSDVVVVGGGLVGLLAVRSLASADRSVHLIESERALGRQASSAAAGMLSPQMESAEGLLVEMDNPVAGAAMLALCIAARRDYARFVREIEAETGLSVHYRADGTLVIAQDESEARHLESTAEAQAARGLAAEYLNRAETRRLEPALSGNMHGALHLPDDHQVDPVALVAAAAVGVSARPGVTVDSGTRVEEILAAGGRVAGVRVTGAGSGSTIEADHVVIAAGAWSGRLAGLPRPLPVRPVKGQMAAVRLPRPPISRIVGGRGAYCVPRDDGRLLIGATVEEAGFDVRVTGEEVATLLAAAARFLPELAQAPVESTWAGLRPGTPDCLPILGEDPELTGLIYATGHYRNGILLAPLTAECVAALVAGHTPPVDLRAFAPDRPSLASN